MNKSIHGRVHGRTIEIDEDLGLSDGQEVKLHFITRHHAINYRSGAKGFCERLGHWRTIQGGTAS